MLVNPPPTRSFRAEPIKVSATAKTGLLGPALTGLKVVSTAPLAASRATKLWRTLLTLVKLPPSTIRPSVWQTMARTEALAPTNGEVEENVWSSEPSSFKRAMRLDRKSTRLNSSHLG